VTSPSYINLAQAIASFWRESAGSTHRDEPIHPVDGGMVLYGGGVQFDGAAHDAEDVQGVLNLRCIKRAVKQQNIRMAVKW